MSGSSYDAVVIGSGPGGYPCGIRLGQLGVTSDRLSDIAQRGTGRSTAWNPRPMAERDVLHVCEMVL